MEAAHGEEVLRAGGLEIHPGHSLALAEGRALLLSVRELALLVALARRPGRIVSRQELHTVVWSGPYRQDDRSVDVYVHKLRVKLERALPDWTFIHTHFGFGYRFAAEASQPFHKTATAGKQTGADAMRASPASGIQSKETP
jgi:DNA-binding response OmpR family regulator